MKVLILDCKLDPPHGSPDLVRSCRNAGFSGEISIQRPQTELPKMESETPAPWTHLIISGSRQSCLSHDPWVEDLVKFLTYWTQSLKRPALGICFGHQMLARAFGGLACLGKSLVPEYGWTPLERTELPVAKSTFLENIPHKFFSFSSHQEEVRVPPQGFQILARSKDCPVQALQHEHLPVFSVQFHPERIPEEAPEYPDSGLYHPKISSTIFEAFLKPRTGVKHSSPER